MSVWRQVVALPLCACLLASCSMRTVRVQNPTVEPATQSWVSVAFIPVVSSVEVNLTTGETITGRFRSADERELVLEQDGLLRRVSRVEIRRVILYKGRHAGRVLAYLGLLGRFAHHKDYRAGGKSVERVSWI